MYDWESSEIIIKLKSTSPNDEIILAMVEPEDTLLQTIQKAEELIEKHEMGEYEELDATDELMIPEINFDLNHEYSDLLDKFMKNPGFETYWCKRAIQKIRFALDKKGAVLRSEAEMFWASVPRRLVFDRPFLLYLKEKDAEYAYFAMWVDNPELMVKNQGIREKIKHEGRKGRQDKGHKGEELKSFPWFLSLES